MSAVFAAVSAAAAQTPPAAPSAGQPGAKPPTPFVEPKLAFDREVFTYPGQGRRDPFKSLGGDDALGPLFEDLALRGIAWSPVPHQSIVLLNDGARKIYKLRVGERVGNARVIGIEKDRVRFAVTSFGMTRPEVMQKAPRKSVAELRAQQAQQSGGKEADVSRLLQQELLRALQVKQDPNPNTTPPVRRDTIIR
jgi:hypothetical protein